MNHRQGGQEEKISSQVDQCSKTASETPRDVDPMFIGAGSSSESLKKKVGVHICNLHNSHFTTGICGRSTCPTLELGKHRSHHWTTLTSCDFFGHWTPIPCTFFFEDRGVCFFFLMMRILREVAERSNLPSEER